MVQCDGTMRWHDGTMAQYFTMVQWYDGTMYDGTIAQCYFYHKCAKIII